MSLLWILVAASGGNTPSPPQPASAQPAAPQTEIVVTGSRVATPPGELAANVTVLSREDFDVEKPRQLGDILRRVAGVHVDQVGGRGGTGSLYLRGADPNYTLVLLDGVRVNDPTNARGGSFDFSNLDVADVERVEIARGPYSAVYGGDALAGVVNIVTRRAPPQDTRASLDAMAGGYGIHEIAFDARGPLGTHAWNFGASDAHEGEVTRGNEFDGQRVSGGVDFALGASTKAFINGRYSETSRKGFPDDSGGYEFAEIRDTEDRDADETTFGTGFNTSVGAATFALQAGYFDRDDHIDSPGVAPGIRDPFGVPPSVVDTTLRRYSATVTGTQKFSQFLTLAYGVDWLREEGSSDGLLDFGGGFVLPTSFALTRDSWAPFAEARIASDFGLSLQAGVRVDQPEDEGSVTSPRLRVEYEFADTGFSVAGAWGKAFKLPSMYALGHPLVGNPDLVPERGESWEIEFAQSLLEGKARWSATWFEGEFRNAIDFDPGPPPMLVNRNRVDTEGVEIAGQLALADDWQLDASVTQVESRVASTGNQLRNRPEWRGGAAAHWRPVAPLHLSAAVTYVGSSLDSSIPTGDVRLDSYTRVDVSAVWQLSPRLETYVAIDNLTDQQYEEFVGNEARGILPRAGVRFSF
jgi:outer membrane cobalamin receptor